VLLDVMTSSDRKRQRQSALAGDLSKPQAGAVRQMMANPLVLSICVFRHKHDTTEERHPSGAATFVFHVAPKSTWQEQRVNSANSKPVVVNRTAAGVFSAVSAALVGALCIFMLVVAGFVIADGEYAVGAVVIAVAAIMLLLFQYALRDAMGKLGWRITIDATSLRLDLPATRSLIHHLEPVHMQIGFDQIAYIETRLEAYRSLGMANMQRNYALMLKTDRRIVLGEDRALGTQMESTLLATVSRRVVESAGIEVRDLGMVEGKGGVLAVLFTSPPRWDAPSVDAKTQRTLWKRVGMTGALASAASLLVLGVAIARHLFWAA
jgi:hypothetical protein